jgi:hypothetical protein
VTGTPLLEFPVVVVVPSAASALRWALSAGPPLSTMSVAELCTEPRQRLAAEIRRAIMGVAARQELASHERPCAVLLEVDAWTVGKGELTTTLKLRRQTLVQVIRRQNRCCHDAPAAVACVVWVSCGSYWYMGMNLAEIRRANQGCVRAAWWEWGQ